MSIRAIHELSTRIFLINTFMHRNGKLRDFVHLGNKSNHTFDFIDIFVVSVGSGVGADRDPMTLNCGSEDPDL